MTGVLDLLLLAALVASSVAWLWPRASGRLRWSLTAVAAVLALLQLGLEGLYLQFAAGEIGAALAVIAGLLMRGRRRPIVRGLAAVIAVGLLLGPWLVAPAVPRLGRPTGPYAVGAITFRWEDASREEPATADPNDRRNVIAEAFYPAEAGARGAAAPYLDTVTELPKSVSGVPREMMRGYRRIDTHTHERAALSASQPRWPVVLFSPGYGAPRAFYTGLATDLASRGVIVLLFDHAFESAFTRLADGREVGDGRGFQKIAGDPNREDAFMVAEQALRAQDLRFGLSRLLGQPPFAGNVDTDRLYAAGHSFGGASAIMAARADSRLAGAINVDGTLYGGLSALTFTKPFLLVESDLRRAHQERYRAGAARMLATSPAAARLEVRGANHFTFTDGLLFFAPPGRWLLHYALGGGRDPRSVHALTAALIDAFVGGGPKAAASVAERDGGVSVSAVKP